MALFMKQDFSPPLLSRKWLAMKFRPNMVIYSRENIVAILESGLLFREDSVEVEQEAPDPETVWSRAGGVKGGWFTSGERNVALMATIGLILASPPKNFHRWMWVKLATYALLPLALRATHRAQGRGSLRALLSLMRDYMSLARRATACCREYTALHARLESVTSAIESTHALLCRQQMELLLLMSRSSSALLGNAPWLRGDLAHDCSADSLMKIHHTFLVVQSTLLKYIALAHHMPTAHMQKIYKNHNERIYWIHNVLVQHLIQEFKENYEALDRMYRLLKNYGTKDSESALKKPGSAITDSWLYSDVHTGIARSCLELKVALDKCNNLDMFLDSCALHQQQLNLDVLDKDIDEIIENITDCLKTAQNSQIRLKKMLNKVKVDEPNNVEEEDIEEATVVKIEDKEPEIRDEVFYFVKTEDETVTSPIGDIVTGPGQKEKENSKVVLKELKRKLVKREDLMRERERQALAKTMPELKSIPEFPRQIPEEFVERKGFIKKIERKRKPIRLFRNYKICRPKSHNNKESYDVTFETYEKDDVPENVFEANANLDAKSVLVSIVKYRSKYYVLVWRKYVMPSVTVETESSGISDSTSYLENSSENDAAVVVRRNKPRFKPKRIPKSIPANLNLPVNVNNINDNKTVNEPTVSKINSDEFKFSKKDLEITSSSSDSEFGEDERLALLKDVRRLRLSRKKNPAQRVPKDNVDVDESLKPIEYNFCTGMAMASVLQVNKKANLPNMAQEEVFIGDGEVSEDSGHDEDG